MPKNTEEATSVDTWLDSLDPAATHAQDAVGLRSVGRALSGLEAAEAALQRAVDDAHASGDSWSAIAMVLGTSRQAAHRKFARTGRRCVQQRPVKRMRMRLPAAGRR